MKKTRLKDVHPGEVVTLIVVEGELQKLVTDAVRAVVTSEGITRLHLSDGSVYTGGARESIMIDDDGRMTTALITDLWRQASRYCFFVDAYKWQNRSISKAMASRAIDYGTRVKQVCDLTGQDLTLEQLETMIGI